jgi:polygalacturonase
LRSACLLTGLSCLAFSATFNVADFGAKNDAKTVNTQAIQTAIDAAEKAGGGQVVFPQGCYLTGALFVKSGVDLHLDEGVTLSAVRDDAAYPEIQTRIAGIEMPWPAAVINIYKQKNAKITGPGIVDGQGDFWWKKFYGTDYRGGLAADYAKRGLRWAVDYDCKRVRAVALYDSSSVEVSGITINRSGFWTLCVTYCENVTIDGVIVRANIGGIGPSSDGIDIDSSRGVLVQNCDIDCNDDNICLKAGRDADGLRVNRPTENVVIRNCVTRAGHGVFVIGSETSGGIRNVEVSDIRAYGTRYGIRFKSARIRGGVVENIRIRNIHMEKVPNPIHIELNWYPAYSYPTLPKGIDPATIPAHWKTLMQRVEPAERGIPLFRNIEISGIRAEQADTAIQVNAFDEKPISGVKLKDILIEARKPGFIRNASDWELSDVTVATPDAAPVKLEKCRAVTAPRPCITEDVLVLPVVSEPRIPKHEVSLTDFGAVGDGVAMNTAAFEAAFAALDAQGGGRLIVPSGQWLTGPITLRSRVELRLQKGALIQFSPRTSDYPVIRSSWEGQASWRCQSPISGSELEDIAITGEGVIDGAGESWRPVKKEKLTESQWSRLLAGGGCTDAANRMWYPTENARRASEDRSFRNTDDPEKLATLRETLRPVMLNFVRCKRVKLEGTLFQNSPAWCLHPLLCEDLTVRRVSVVNAPYAQNGDAIDVESCNRVLIEDSSFDAGDDALCVKSGRDAEGRKRGVPSQNILIRNCIVHHGHGGFVVGSEMSGGVKNVVVQDCTFLGTDVGLRFKSTRGRGGVVERVRISGIRMLRIPGEAILFDLFYMGKKAAPGEKALIPAVTEETPSFRDIAMRDITCSGAQRAGFFQGLVEMPLLNISLKDSTLSCDEGIKIVDAEKILLTNVSIITKKGPSVSIQDGREISIDSGKRPCTVQASGERSSAISLKIPGGQSSVKFEANLPAGAIVIQP